MIININTKDKTSGTSTNFTYSFEAPLPMKQITLIGYSLPNSEYIVNSYNNIFSYTYGVNTYVISIPTGNYTYLSLQNTILPLLPSTSGVTFTMTSNISKMIYTIESSAIITFNWATYPLAAKLLGFTSYTTGVSHVGSKTWFISQSPIYYFNILNVGYQNYDKGVKSIGIIYNDLTSGNILAKKDESMVKYVKLDMQYKLKNLVFTISDINGNIPDFNGNDIFLQMKIR
jgi:hypothetical protein